MLRIHREPTPGFITIRLEGKLIRPWTDELFDAWMGLMADSARGEVIRIDLDAVSFVDDRGRTTLRALHRAGCELCGTGPFISALIEEIKGPNAV